jgi:hypothetical protein
MKGEFYLICAITITIHSGGRWEYDTTARPVRKRREGIHKKWGR